MTTKRKSTFKIQAGNTTFTFLNSGDLFEAANQGIMINQWQSNPIDGGLNNLYLRIHKTEGISAFPLLGSLSKSRVKHSDSQVIWEGTADGIAYAVTFSLTDKGIWFWEVEAEGEAAEIDVIYAQDIGLADKGAVRTNEAYVSQYVDHSVYEDEEKGFVVCSRQNQPSSSGFPYLQQGSLTKTSGYSTDGFQFFGLSYKESNEPEALKKEGLANENYQYEFGYTALQSERVPLSGKERFVFYGLFKENHENAVTQLEYMEEIEDAWRNVQSLSLPSFDVAGVSEPSTAFGLPLQTLPMSAADIDELYPERQMEEYEGDQLLSFFTKTHEHVVLKEKEMMVERPHGHILVSGNNVGITEEVITSTSYIYGVFNSHIVKGNTSFNKMMTNTRNPLNVIKTSGQRIYVERNGEFQLLTMPSLFEIGFNYVRWYYKTDNDTLKITNYTTVSSPEINLEVQSLSGEAYRYLVTNQISMNNNEYEVDYSMEINGNVLTFRAGSEADSANVYPGLRYDLQVTGTDFSVRDEQVFGNEFEPGCSSLVVLELQKAANWKLSVQGQLHGGEPVFEKRDIDEEIQAFREFYKSITNGFHLSLPGNDTEEIQKVNSISWWYTHNMLVHYSVPHGLEQYGGAAWGTRDVCQGPAEYFLATHNHKAVREIIQTVYSHQYESTGNWPQWFMFDRYSHIQQHESHGDIIVWPLKALSDYLKATTDFGLLEDLVPYTTEKGDFTEKAVPLYDHVKKQLAYIKDHFLHGTFLSSYGDGDWDDTLQPANAQLKQYMVSSWTVSLTYQVLSQFSSQLRSVNEEEAAFLESIAEGIKQDFNTHILSAGTIPGFLYMEEPGTVEWMLHPTDEKTGIQYRLLPMTRSMISELLSPEQAAHHYELIEGNMLCPDGVRLMNRPAHYAGGVSTRFKRAEQAANFGREIGLQYVHAHIRFVEAMAKLGKSEHTWDGLATINPITIQQVVPNAERRQSNAYFSSSDGKFNTRYEAQERFNELKDGSVPVKGGWRIYSSGPGIFMNQLISNCLGIRLEDRALIIDPVLPDKLDGLVFDYHVNGLPVSFRYDLSGRQKSGIRINGKEAGTEVLSNRYRTGGFRISLDEFNAACDSAKEINIIEIRK
ncbi:GH36-type glycosyl hydrolase domain-containing protein [Fictibacillus sp. S7]|uniref:GH36-type glycosyl hydrolase domain-containing protein n=1 Tax=Fictibacillus sp. S7 TaxID=2212476 RepID=UPI001011C6C2|nr:cellobiose phosphorylase [Fictibacillus sp. S7]RXY99748.1 cellobiose phosphorylase [Fictibacillus sp. S7]